MSISPVLKQFIIPANDTEMRDGADVEFVFLVNYGGNLFPLARVADVNDPRTAQPWKFKVRDIRFQRDRVTILSNIINVTRAEKTTLHYVIEKPGMVTIQVFTMDGDIVDILFRGRRDAGEYSTTWDGRNREGNTVARGVYFISIVGPDINEIRKVLVVK